MKKTLATMIALLAFASPTLAAIVQVDVVGSVDFNVIVSGPLDRVSNPVGTPVNMSFQLDSNNFLNGNFPTRGYPISQSSFVLNVGATTVNMANPYPAGQTPYFVLRNNDPMVDGFLLASHPDVAQANGVWTDETASLEPTFRSLFSATYGGSTLSSLDILGAVGTYTFAGLSVFNWGLEDASFQPIGFIFDYFTISVVPAPSAAGLLLVGGLAAARRRRGC